MQDQEKHSTAPVQAEPEETSSGKKKKNKGKSFLETVREIDEKERQREEELEERRQQILAERKKKEQEAYEKRIREERIELMRLKQGVITESEIIHEEKEEKPKLSFWKKHYRVPGRRIRLYDHRLHLTGTPGYDRHGADR